MSQQLEIDFDNLAGREPLQLLSIDEIYAQASHELLVRLKEDKRIERKTQSEHASVISKYLSMWSNTSPDGGLIACGIENSTGTILGCSSLSQPQLNSLEGAGHTHCPDAKYITKRVRVIKPNGDPDFVVLFRVFYNEAKVVETHSGEAWRRVSDKKCRLSDLEKQELALDKGQVSVELEPCGLTYPEDFEIDAVKKFTAMVRSKKQIEESISDSQILENHRLAKTRGGEFIPNIACALLFAKDPRAAIPGCMIRFLKYQGEFDLTGTDRNVVREETIEGRIPDIIVQTSRIIDSQTRVFSSLGNDGRFYSQPEYPRDAWYEAVVNACVHRSYGLKGMNIFIKMFDNRLVVESPGGFMPFVNSENIYESHVRRNPFLMEAMLYLTFVKCENEGVKRIRNDMAKMQLPPPEFEQKELNGVKVRVTLRNNAKQRKAWVDSEAARLIVGDAMFKSLTEEERIILNSIAEYGKISVTQAARLTETRWQRSAKILKHLADQGIIARRHTRERDSQSYYYLPEPDDYSIDSSGIDARDLLAPPDAEKNAE